MCTRLIAERRNERGSDQCHSPDYSPRHMCTHLIAREATLGLDTFSRFELGQCAEQDADGMSPANGVLGFLQVRGEIALSFLS